MLGGRLDDVALARALARRTLRVVRQNLAWAAAYNAVCVPLALAGWLPPWAAGLGMAASSLLVVAQCAARSARFAAAPTPMDILFLLIPLSVLLVFAHPRRASRWARAGAASSTTSSARASAFSADARRLTPIKPRADAALRDTRPDDPRGEPRCAA